MRNVRRQELQDLERLSAYLDDALSPEAQHHLESRLAIEPELKNQLEALQVTKSLLRNLLPIKAPHNFTLSPDMVPAHRRNKQPLFTTLRLASSLAAILLVVLVGVDVFLARNMMTLSPAEPKVMMESAHMADDAQPEPLILWAPSRPESGGGDAGVAGLGSSDFFTDEQFASEAEILPSDGIEVEEAEVFMEEPEADDVTPSLEPPLEREPLLADEPESMVEEPIILSAEPEGGTPILGINPEQSGEIVQRSQSGTFHIDSPASWTDNLRWLQIFMAAIAVSGGAMIWFLQRRKIL